jgi:hypothetical protein
VSTAKRQRLINKSREILLTVYERASGTVEKRVNTSLAYRLYSITCGARDTAFTPCHVASSLSRCVPVREVADRQALASLAFFSTINGIYVFITVNRI